jgi:uncharacterized BrkB/YihY/UPF0761 family membrane protein
MPEKKLRKRRAWPAITVLALVIMFAAYAFSDAVLHSARAFSSGGGGSVIGHLLVGLRPSLGRSAHRPWDSVA